MLDSLRYMVVWLPAILMVAHVALHVFGLDPPKADIAPASNATTGMDPTLINTPVA